MEQDRTGDGASGAPGGCERGRPGGGGLEDVVCSSRVAWLHGCMVAPSADVVDQEAEEIFWGGLVQSSGGRWWPAAGLRQAQALPWPWEMRLAQNGGMRTRVVGLRGTRGRRGEPRKEANKKTKRMQVRGSLMGTPRAVVGAAGAVVVGTLSGSQ